MSQSSLLEQLETDLRQSLEQVRSRIAPMDFAAMQWRPTPEQWNILECFAHQNAYLERYIPRMELAIHKAKARQWTPAKELKYAGAAKRFIRKADPDNSKPYKSPKHYNFHQKPLGKETIKGFTINAERLLRVIQSAKEIDLNKAKVERGKSGFFKLNLGNTLEWQVTLIRRQVVQAQTLIAQMKERGLFA